MPRIAAAALIICALASDAPAQSFQPGTVIESVQCAADATQSYALYLPSNYSSGRMWSVLFAFHPAARGRLMVEKYQAAAERYGYVIAASNNSRNGPWAASLGAAQAMVLDVSRRFALDPRRVYFTGMSGGSRVALAAALADKQFAGVIASSAGFPDSQPRTAVPFAIYGTAGTEDFNYMEMRMLDRKLTSPHFLAVFVGGHTLPPDDVAVDAIEWMELQAMQSGRRSRDEAFVARLLEKRRTAIAASPDSARTVYLLRALVSDFKGLGDVSADAARLEQMLKDGEVKKALKRERDGDDAEARMLQDIYGLEARLGDDEQRDVTIMMLRERLARLSKKAQGDADTPERSQARRVLRSITAGAAGRVQDREYLKVLEQFRLPGR